MRGAFSGTAAGTPRFSAYVASKAALDAFSRCIASEIVGDGVRITTIHMPQVRTPMIEPTKFYEAFPAISPDEAAGMIADAERSEEVSAEGRAFAEFTRGVHW
jgi:NAD(P)-dependent dehydrogenase (short-subunit alcohol dehydrogenase family)